MAQDYILWTTDNCDKLRCAKINLYLSFLRHSIHFAINVFGDAHLSSYDLACVSSRITGWMEHLPIRTCLWVAMSQRRRSRNIIRLEVGSNLCDISLDNII